MFVGVLLVAFAWLIFVVCEVFVLVLLLLCFAVLCVTLFAVLGFLFAVLFDC